MPKQIHLTIWQNPICKWISNILASSKITALAPLVQWPINVWIPIPDMLPEMEVKTTDINRNAIVILKWRMPT
jgi:hypothetical protein